LKIGYRRANQHASNNGQWLRFSFALLTAMLGLTPNCILSRSSACAESAPSAKTHMQHSIDHDVIRNILPIDPNDLLYGASMRLGKTSIDSHQLFDFAQNTFLFSLCILLLRLCLFILRIVRF
jgi:hypothetical protein